MKTILTTDRLILRELNLEDTDFIIELLNSPGWLQYIGDRNVRTKEEAVAYLQNGPLKSYTDNGFGLFMVEEKSQRRPVGMCGILKRTTLSYPDIGFAFLPGFQGQGYAYEVSSALIKHCKNNWNINTLGAITLPDNERSIHLLERLGMKFKEKIIMPPANEELLLYTSQI